MIEIRLRTGQTIQFEGDHSRLQQLFPQIKQARLQNEWIAVEDQHGRPACYFPAESVAYIGIVVGARAESTLTHSQLHRVPGDGSQN